MNTMTANINELDMQELKREIFKKNIQLSHHEVCDKKRHNRTHKTTEYQIKKELDTLLYKYYKSMYRQ